MRLGVKDVAQRLGATEAKVFEWVDRHKLPATRVEGQFRFSPAAVYEWATSRGIPIHGDLFQEGAEAPASLILTGALRAGGIVAGLQGKDKTAILHAAVERLNLPPHVDRAVILDMLLARERLGSSAIGDGFAIPHVRNPIVLRVPAPLVTLFLLDHPIEFAAADRKMVHSLFLMITPTIQTHLIILSRLASVLQDEKVRQVIVGRASTESILSEIEASESRTVRVGGNG